MKPSWRQVTTIAKYYTRYAAAAAAVLGVVVAGALNSVSLRAVPAVQYNTYECAAGETLDAPEFRVLAYVEAQAVKHADALCEHPTIRRSYSRVHVMWRHRDLNEVRIIFDQQFDLLLTKPEFVERTDIDLIARYVPIAVYGDNTSRFISLQSQPKLTATHLSSRTLGLLDNPNSVSGHQVPRQAIRNAGIDERLLDIRYYETHGDLYAALIAGELDVIATGLALPDHHESEQPHFILPIQEGLKSPRWYLRPPLVDTPLHCHVVSILEEISANSDVIFEQGIEIVRDCRL